MNTGGYRKEDLHDVNKTRNAGVNVKVYPNTVYSKRDKNGERVFVNGHNPKEKGVAVGIGISYADIDKKRDVAATVGNGVNINHDISGVNRDPNRQTGEFEGREITGVDVNLGTEYWLTAAGRGKTRDIIEDAGRSAKGIKKILTRKDENGNLALLKNIKSESHLRELERRGFTDLEGKTLKEIQKEVEEKFGDLGEKGIKVRFFDKNDIDTSNLTKDQIKKLLADGFATTGDGYIWLNKERLENGNTVDINGVIQHEITHQVMGEDSEHEARYVEDGYVDFLKGIKKTGYLTDGEIVDYNVSSLNTQDRERLGRYVDSDMQYKLFVDASSDINDEDREKIIKYLEELTGYDLELKKNKSGKYEKVCDNVETDKCGYEIDFVKDAKKNKKELDGNAKRYIKSNKLVNELIETTDKVFITNEKDNSRKKKLGADIDGSHVYGNVVKLNTIDVVKTQVWDGNEVRKEFEKIPKFVELAHELIHVYHWLGLGLEPNQTTRYTADVYKKHYVKMPNSVVESFSIDKNNKKLNGYDLEELITIGIGNSTEENAKKNGIRERGEYNIDSDITENDIRKEHKCVGVNCAPNDYSLNFRISHSPVFDSKISPEEKIRVDKIIKELEKRK